MEYLHDYGSFSDLRYEKYLEELRSHYPHIFGERSAEGLIFDFRKAGAIAPAGAK